VVPVKVLSSSGSGSMSQIVAGLDWVAANSARIDVVNMSLGGVGTSSALNNAVQNLVNRGVTVVVAAGNSNRDARVIAPANATDVITVSALADYNGRAGGGATATCRNAGADDSTASFSNYGTVVEIAAPGVCINSTRRGGGTTVMSGTSMASPHVAGAAAILASRSRPTNRAGVQALSQTLISAGSTAWTDNKPDGVKERLLDVSNASIFNPVIVGGPSNPVPTTTTTVPGGPVPTTTTTAPPTTRPTLSVAGVSWLGWRSATLTWSGIAGAQVAVYRNGMLVATVANTGSHADLAGFLVARATYRVCAAGSTSACSSDVNVTF
jgi:subtilisin family serine protease